MPFPRMTTRRWMVVVGTAALAFAGIMALPDQPPLLLFAAGPIGGIAWVACGDRRSPFAFTRGAATATAVESALLMPLIAIGYVVDDSGSIRGILTELQDIIALMFGYAFFHIAIGSTAGLLVDYFVQQMRRSHSVSSTCCVDPPTPE